MASPDVTPIARLVDDDWVQFRMQEVADQEALDRKYGLLAQVDMVFDVVAAWDFGSFLDRHRTTVQRILDDKRNARRKLSDLTGKELRRQHAIRLVEATALNNITQAEYCRRSGLKPYEATRWIASFCEQEPGLREALSAIGACLETVFSEKVQQRRVLLQKVKEPNVTLVPGFDPDTLQDTGHWLSNGLSSGVRRCGAGWLPLALVPDEDFHSPEFHRPETWARDPDLDWGVMVERPRPFGPDRVWPKSVYNENLSKVALAKWPERSTIARRVKLKSGRHEVWRVARAASPVRHVDFHCGVPAP